MAKKYYIEDGEAIPAIVYSVSQPAGFTEITDPAELLRLHKQRYNVMTEAGQDFYNEFRTKLYLEIVAGNIIPAEAFAVEAHLAPLRDQLMSGNWLTAQDVSINLALSGIYDQPLKDEIQTGIDDFVTENY